MFVVTDMTTSNKTFKFMFLPQREDNVMHPFETSDASILFNYEFSVDHYQLPTGYPTLVGHLHGKWWSYKHVFWSIMNSIARKCQVLVQRQHLKIRTIFIFQICAPRWKNAYNSNYYLMNGICYWTDNTTDVEASMETIMPLVDLRKYKTWERRT